MKKWANYYSNSILNLPTILIQILTSRVQIERVVWPQNNILFLKYRTISESEK